MSNDCTYGVYTFIGFCMGFLSSSILITLFLVFSCTNSLGEDLTIASGIRAVLSRLDSSDVDVENQVSKHFP